MGDIVARALTALEAAQSGPTEVWISLVDQDEVARAAARVEDRLAAGQELPLAGTTLAVKDNIDVAGTETTAGCPAYAYRPVASAPCVRALVESGAVVIGKTNMDQFATGLVGTRSPYGAVRNSINPLYVAGGSSSGSAVAVAVRAVDLALGTDTAGSGRVPAACNGIVGLKPSRGVVSTQGVVPACASLDCVSVLARSVEGARRAFEVLARRGPLFPYQRPRQVQSNKPIRVIGVPDISELEVEAQLSNPFEAVSDRLLHLGYAVEAVSLAPFLEAGRLVYGGALVAERYASVGKFIEAHREDVDPVVRDIILGSRAVRGYEFAADQNRLAELRVVVEEAFLRVDALVLPTLPFHPTIDEVQADPYVVNERLGRYSSFCNPLDLCAITIPCGLRADGLPFGITVYAPAMSDVVLAEFARYFVNENLGR